MNTRMAAMMALLVVVGVCLVSVPVVMGAPVGMGKPPVVVLKTPDLAIRSVVLAGKSGGDFPSGTVDVTVKNKGDGRSRPCVVAVMYSNNVVDDQSPVVTVRQELGGLEPGETETLSFSFLNVGLTWRALVVVCVDAPVPGHPSGQVLEKKETNNVFGTTFDTKGKSLPHSLRGPIED